MEVCVATTDAIGGLKNRLSRHSAKIKNVLDCHVELTPETVACFEELQGEERLVVEAKRTGTQFDVKGGNPF